MEFFLQLLKSINQFYNLKKAKLQKQLPSRQYWSHCLSLLTKKEEKIKYKYKFQLVEIKVIKIEESYTSFASFLDLNEIPIYGQVKEREEVKFSGERIKRGLYRSDSGKLINTNCNTLCNIRDEKFLSKINHDRILVETLIT